MLEGETRPARVLSFVEWVDRHGIVEELLAIVRNDRPKAKNQILFERWIYKWSRKDG